MPEAGLRVRAMVEVDWAAVRAEYEGSDKTIAEIALERGITKDQINARKKAEGWEPRHRTVAVRRDILSRLYRILDGQTRRMETAMDKDEGGYGMSDLANVTRTLEKLISLNRAEERRKRNPPESAVMKQLRDKLADRIEQLNQG